ncbi:MAG TPA: TolC family protein [Daejeonella sp.]|uniref:TolC family protein n=1 Tax=Daejeonella sp. TaxID=2805397 RepID=UPI002ED78188
MKSIAIVIFAGLISLSAEVFSQDTISLSRKDIWAKVSERNLQLQIQDQDYKSAQADFKQSNSLFLPDVSLSHTGTSSTNPLIAFGSKLNQEILTASDFNPALLNNPDVTSNFATKFQILQPLLNLDGVYGRQAAKSKMEAIHLQSERSKEYLELESVKAFMQLQLAYKAVDVLRKAELTAGANLKLIESYFNQGMLQMTDVLSVKVRVNEIKNQVQLAKSNTRNASDYLAFLMQEDMNGKVYRPVEELENSISINESGIGLSESRKDIMAMTKSTEAYHALLKSSKMTFLPRLNAFGTYEMYDNKVFGARAKGYLLGVQLSWNVFDGYKSIGKRQKALADYQKSEAETNQYKAQSQMELNKTSRQLNDAGLKVSLSKLALEQSQEAYRIHNNRFKQGLEKTSDLLGSETQMFQKELEYLQAVFEYNFTQQYLSFLTK